MHIYQYRSSYKVSMSFFSYIKSLKSYNILILYGNFAHMECKALECLNYCNMTESDLILIVNYCKIELAIHTNESSRKLFHQKHNSNC